MKTPTQPPAAGQAAHTVCVPELFFSDHEARGLPTPSIVRREGRRLVIPLNGDETNELLADAQHYAHPDGPFESIALKSSARATSKAISEARAALAKAKEGQP